MSLVQDLADQLRLAREELPLPQVAGATERLRTAAGLIAWALHESTRPVGAPSLGRAVEHLEHATAALRVAQEALDDYALALGLPAAADLPPDPVWQSSLALPTQPARVQTQARTDARLTHWWTNRVDELSGDTGLGGPAEVDQADGAPSSAELLHRCVGAALDNDRGLLHRHLVAAGPGVGLGLSAIAPSLLRYLATELIGHPPRLEDLARVRRAALPLVGEVMPAMPAEAAEEIIARVCYAAPRRARRPAHPVDGAAAAALLVAGLMRATSQGADSLGQVIDAERLAAGSHDSGHQPTEPAASNRAALRITDSARRRSAVDELSRVASPVAPRSGG